MKFTKSRDGALRATVSVKARVGREDIVNAVCYQLTHSDGIEDVAEMPRITKAYVERTVRDILYRVGYESYGYWSDDVDNDLADEIEVAVDEAVIKLYPELAR